MVVARASGMDLASILKRNTFLTLEVRPVGGPGSARDGGTGGAPGRGDRGGPGTGGQRGPRDGGTEAAPGRTCPLDPMHLRPRDSTECRSNDDSLYAIGSGGHVLTRPCGPHDRVKGGRSFTGDSCFDPSEDRPHGTLHPRASNPQKKSGTAIFPDPENHRNLRMPQSRGFGRPRRSRSQHWNPGGARCLSSASVVQMLAAASIKVMDALFGFLARNDAECCKRELLGRSWRRDWAMRKFRPQNAFLGDRKKN